MKTKILALCFGLGLLLAVLQPSFAQEPPRPPLRQEPPQPRPSVEMPLLMQRPLPQQPPEAIELTPEAEKQALEYIQQFNPKEAEELGRIKFIHPERYAERLRHALLEKHHLERLHKDDPARYEREIKIRELERQTYELAESYRQAQDEATQKTMRSNLANVVAQLFDLREMNRQEEVKRMEAELKRLKETLAQRQKNRAEIIERRVQQMTGEAGAVEWE